MKNYCIFLYSHSDYSDVWPLTFGQIHKHVNLDEVDMYFCVDKLNDYKVDEKINVVCYDNSLCYTERVLSNIRNLNYEYVLFLHEDWVITNTYNNKYVLDVLTFMKTNNILHIRSYINYGRINHHVYLNDDQNINLVNIPNDAEYFISLQPGLWKLEVLIELYSFNSNKPNLLEILSNSNNFFRNKCYNKFFCENIKLSEDSKMYPHIHTVAYGKWELLNDSYKQLDSLFKEYNIDKTNRGVL
jgi:hypothetical protein